MNKAAFKKNIGSRLRLKPISKRFVGGPTGPQLPPVDDDWLVQGFEKDGGVRISNSATGHGTVLARDQVHHFSEDSERGKGSGTITLNTQLNIGGNALWTEPTFRPGEVLPDQFRNVRGWKRENDAVYIQNLCRAQVMPQPTSGNSALVLLTCLCVGIGIGLLIADA